MSQKMRDLLKLSTIIAVAFGLGLTLAQALDIPRPGHAESRASAPGGSFGNSSTAPDPVRRADGIPSFAEIVDRVNASVVYVQTLGRSGGGRGDPSVPPEFQDMFRRFQQQQPRLRPGAGSGFIVSRDGYILTNNHVVADAERVSVTLLDNRRFDARVVGRDPNTDVAVIKIDATDLPAVTFGNSESLRIGDWVLAVGNPLGFTFTVTAGIVSAKGRQLDGLRDPGQSYSIQDFIQTDAAINPGNSGGPLFNLSGEVVGINSAIASQTGLYSGYGFAIPINLARRIMQSLIETGRVERTVLGIRIGDVTPDIADYVGLERISGVVVGTGFPENSPARAAGIREGDVIVALNDTLVAHVAQLQQMVGFRRPGDVVRVTVVRREGERRNIRRTFDVRLQRAEEPREVASSEGAGESTQPGETEGKLGLRIAPLTPSMAEQASLSEEQRGVLVSDVEEGGPAWQRVLPPTAGGPEIILSVNGQRVRTPAEFNRMMNSVNRNEVVQLRVLNLQALRDPTARANAVRIAYVRARD